MAYLIIFILFQGQHYWKLKLYRLTGKKFDQPGNINLFKKAKKINSYLIAFIPVIFILQFYVSGWKIKPQNLMIWGLAANLFGVLEHLNYYYWQLMVDNSADLTYLLKNKKLKSASLAKDLKDNEI